MNWLKSSTFSLCCIYHSSFPWSKKASKQAQLLPVLFVSHWAADAGRAVFLNATPAAESEFPSHSIIQIQKDQLSRYVPLIATLRVKSKRHCQPIIVTESSGATTKFAAVQWHRISSKSKRITIISPTFFYTLLDKHFEDHPNFFSMYLYLDTAAADSKSSAALGRYFRKYFFWLQKQHIKELIPFFMYTIVYMAVM